MSLHLIPMSQSIRSSSNMGEGISAVEDGPMMCGAAYWPHHEAMPCELGQIA
jgi:hypothetical protein